MQAKAIKIEKQKLNPYLPKDTFDTVVITFVDGSQMIVSADPPYGEDAALSVEFRDSQTI